MLDSWRPNRDTDLLKLPETWRQTTSGSENERVMTEYIQLALKLADNLEALAMLLERQSSPKESAQ